MVARRYPKMVEYLLNLGAQVDECDRQYIDGIVAKGREPKKIVIRKSTLA